jgi:hypothetical protein
LKWGDGKNPDLIRYTLEMRRQGASFQAIYHGTSHVHKVNKLNESTDYQFRIFASNDAGDGPSSDIYTFRTTKAPPVAPKAPKVTDLTTTSCNVEWLPTKSSSSQDSFIYILQLHHLSIRNMDYREVYRGSSRSFHVDNLSPKSDYQVRVCAVRHLTDDDGSLLTLSSPFSTATLFTTPSAARSNNDAVQSTASVTVKSLDVARTSRPSIPPWIIVLLLTVAFGCIAVGLALIAKQFVE